MDSKKSIALILSKIPHAVSPTDITVWFGLLGVGLVYWGLTPQQQPGSYQGGEMMMKSVFWWRKPEYPEETTDLRQVTDETFHTYGLCPVREVQGLNLGRNGDIDITCIHNNVMCIPEKCYIYGLIMLRVYHNNVMSIHNVMCIPNVMSIAS